MALPRLLVLVLAGGAGGRLQLLTANRAKPAVPFAGVYRLVDFPLSNCQHSNIADVWVSIQQHPTSLVDHLANGRPWDLDRTSGGLLTLPPFQGTERGGGGAAPAPPRRPPGHRPALGPAPDRRRLAHPAAVPGDRARRVEHRHRELAVAAGRPHPRVRRRRPGRRQLRPRLTARPTPGA